MTHRLPRALMALAIALCAHDAFAQLSLRDDMNRQINMKKPATRVVTLAPFLTESLFAAGAGDLAVGVDEHSTYPPQVFSVPKVPMGANFAVDRLAALKPDLVLAWRDGIRAEDIQRITDFGATVYVATARHLDDVPRLLRTVGMLTGRDASAAAAEFESRMEKLRRENASKPAITTFVEIWHRPLTTVSGNHFLSEALEVCRARNVFAALPGMAPKVSIEGVQEKDPYMIIGAGSASSDTEFRNNWQVRTVLNAVKQRRLLYVDDESISRPTPRTPAGIARLCSRVDDIRAGRIERVVETAAAAPPAPAAIVSTPVPAAPAPEPPKPAPAAPLPAPAVASTPGSGSQPEPARPWRPRQYGM